jgi:hypothetical protein
MKERSEEMGMAWKEWNHERTRLSAQGIQFLSVERGRLQPGKEGEAGAETRFPIARRQVMSW